MRVYNYASFAEVFSKGIIKPNMTKIAKILLEPVIRLGNCVNRHGEPYTIDNKSASLWYKQEADIPENLKKAADDGRVYKGIGKYFTDEVLDKVLSGVKADDMMTELLNLIKESDLSEMEKGDLNKLYEDGDLGGFLGRALLYAILQDNMKKDASYGDYSKTAQETASDINHEIEAFRQFVGQFKKPVPLSPPSTIATEEMKYVTELFRVYQEKRECKIVCVNRYCMNLLYAPYWGKQR